MNTNLYLSYIHDQGKLEQKLGGVFTEARIQGNTTTVTYIPVKCLNYVVHVWNCKPRLAKRTHTKTHIETKTLDLHHPRAKELFKTLIDEMDIRLNHSGYYFIKTDKELDILGDLLTIENLSKELKVLR